MMKLKPNLKVDSPDAASRDRQAGSFSLVQQNAHTRVLSLSERDKIANARVEQKIASEQRRVKYAPVVLALRDPAMARDVIASAFQQVQLWRSKSLCSLDYIEAWDGLLKRPLDAAAILEEDSQYAAQLRQNAPFVSILRKLKSAHAA